MSDEENSEMVATSDSSAPPTQHLLEYSGEAKAFGWLVFKNTLLTIITLGFYRFWAKTRLRKYIWGNQSVFGEKLEYTGTGKELFLGFLVVLAVLVPLAIIFNVVSFYIQTKGGVAAILIFQLAYVILFVFLYGYAVLRARRYQLSRTQWRGIRFAQAGDPKRYGFQFLGLGFLAIITFGMAIPFMMIRLHKYRVDNTYLGQERFTFDGKAIDIFWQWFLCGVLAYITLGLSVLWFMAFLIRYTVSKTRFGPLTFSLPVKFSDYAKIYVPFALVAIVSYLLFAILIFATASGPVFQAAGIDVGDLPVPKIDPIIAYVTFFLIGILTPTITAMMITHRIFSLFADKLETEGEIDLDAFVQNAQEVSKRGEGLADALDVGGGAGIEVGL